MDKQSYEYLKEKVEQFEILREEISKVNGFIQELNECKNIKRLCIKVSDPGYQEKSIVSFRKSCGMTNEFILKHFYEPLLKAAENAKAELEQKLNEL